MINKIEVDGFKSLSRFRLKFKKGLNVLVGPNGAGKTNIISFFEFISLLPTRDLGSAISAMGGAGAIFRKIGQDSFCEEIKLSVTGSTNIASNKFVLYEYSAGIRISEETETVFYNSQRIRLKYRTVDSDADYSVDDQGWDLDLTVSLGADAQNNIDIKKINFKKISKNLSRYSPDKLDDEQYKNYINQFLSDFNAADDSIINSYRLFGDEFHYIIRDFISSKYYNIVPSMIKNGEDASSEPVINKDGSGLSATLYAIKKINSGGRKHRNFMYGRRHGYASISNVKLDKISEYIQIANSTIKRIDVNSSPFDNKLQVKIVILDQNGQECELPLSTMSDGTLKWIAFITLLLSNRSIFAVEEPENYLHPNMQSELIRLMRNFSSESGQILISTHSETVLNNLKPDEIIVVSFDDGKTRASWLDNQSDINDEIKRTGFGLGYYYVTGGLQ